MYCTRLFDKSSVSTKTMFGLPPGADPAAVLDGVADGVVDGVVDGVLDGEPVQLVASITPRTAHTGTRRRHSAREMTIDRTPIGGVLGHYGKPKSGTNHETVVSVGEDDRKNCSPRCSTDPPGTFGP